jgi:signal transduction histidine kinase
MRLRHRISFRVHLTLWYVVTLGVVLAIAGYAVNVITGQLFQLELDEGLRAQSQTLAAAYDPGTAQIASDTLGSLGREGQLFALLDAQGNVTQYGGALDASEVPRLRDAVLSSSQPGGDLTYGPPQGAGPTYRLAVATIERDNRVLGTLVVGAPEFSVGDMTHRHLFAVLAIFALTLLFGALPGYWLATRAMRPVRDITRLARDIGETDLSRRLNIHARDELGELARTFDAMLSRLEGAFERQRQFTADASHELRTPVSIISLEAQRALGRPRSSDEYRAALSTIQAESERMTGLVGDLLALARAERGWGALDRQDLDLSDVALEVVERLAPVAHQHQLQVTVGELPELLVSGDHASIVRMLTNVVDNAIKYTPGAGNHIHVATGRRSDNGHAWAWVRVEDDGPGIEAADLQHVFERFYRADAARTSAPNGHAAVEPGERSPAPTRGGHGLGLAIARSVARGHGGEISARNRPGGGVAFEIILPLAS